MIKRDIPLLDRIASLAAKTAWYSLTIGVIIAIITWFSVSLTAWEFALIAAFWPVVAFLAVVAAFI